MRPALALAAALVMGVVVAPTAPARASDAAPSSYSSSSSFQGSTGHDGDSTAVLGSGLHSAWTVTRTGQFSWTDQADGRVFALEGEPLNPATPRGAESELLALSAVDGEVLWQAPVPGGARASLSDGLVIIGSGGIIQARDQVSGAALWTTFLPEGNEEFPVAADGVVVVAGGNGVVGLDELTGARLWAQTYAFGEGFHAASIVDGLVVVESGCGEVAALALHTGTVVWQTRICQGYGFEPATAVHDGRVYSRAWTGEFHTTVYDLKTGAALLDDTSTARLSTFSGDHEFSTTNGQVEAKTTSNVDLWTSSASDYGGPTLAVDGHLFAASTKGRVDALDPDTGAVTWTAALTGTPEAQYFKDPTPGMSAADGLLVVPSGNALNAFAGSAPRPGAPVPAPPVGAPVIGVPPVGASSWTTVGGSSRHDHVAGLDAFAGDPKPAWSVDLGTIPSQPVIVPGAVLVGSYSSAGPVVHGYSPATGKELWPATTVPITSDWPGFAASGLGIAVFTTSDGGLFAIEIATGRVLWSKDKQTVDPHQTPMVVGREVLVEGAHLDLFSGAVLGHDRAVPVDGLGSSDGVTHYDVSACVIAFRFDQGFDPTWTYKRTGCQGGGSRPSALEGDQLIVRPGNIALDTTSGEVADVYPGTFAPVRTGDVVFIDDDGDIVAEQAGTHRTFWRQTLSAKPLNAPIVVGDRLLVEDVDYDVFELSIADGSVLWSTTLPTLFDDYKGYDIVEPAVAQGVIVIPTRTGIQVFTGDLPVPPVPPLPVAPTPPIIVTPPAPGTVIDGILTHLTCVAAGLDLTHQWQVSSDGGLTWTDLVGATSSDLALTPSLSEDGWLYRDVVTGNAGATATSAPAALHVALPLSAQRVLQLVPITGAVFGHGTTISGVLVDGAGQRVYGETVTVSRDGALVGTAVTDVFGRFSVVDDPHAGPATYDVASSPSSSASSSALASGTVSTVVAREPVGLALSVPGSAVAGTPFRVGASTVVPVSPLSVTRNGLPVGPININPIGTANYVASYAGDADHLPSVVTQAVVTQARANAVTLSASRSSVVRGGGAGLTVTVFGHHSQDHVDVLQVVGTRTTVIRHLLLSSTGRASTVIHPTGTASYRAVFSKDTWWAFGASRNVPVKVT